MASIRSRVNKDGSTVHVVLYRLNGRQSSLTFTDGKAAEAFRAAADAHGPARALEMHGLSVAPRRGEPTLTVTAWVQQHIDQLTGVRQYTVDKYRAYLANDITPNIGAIPLVALTEADIAAWVKRLEESGAKPKTIKNKHGFLSGALSKAVPKHLPSNPAAGRRLPAGTGDDDELRMLTRDEFAALLRETTEPWRPLVEFMVASGARWGEVSALKPADVDRDAGTVKIRRAWEKSSKGYQIGPPKTKRSKRTINVPIDILDKLNYDGEWLFLNRAGGPVRYHGFRTRVWDKAVARAKLDPAPTPHDLRHTCASWMLTGGVPITVVSRHLGHESIKITVDTYGDVDQASASLAADFMSKALTG